MQEDVIVEGKPIGANFGSLLLRVIYHYWNHIGESLSIRQMLGHTGLPDFVGNTTAKPHTGKSELLAG